MDDYPQEIYIHGVIMGICRTLIFHITMIHYVALMKLKTKAKFHNW